MVVAAIHFGDVVLSSKQLKMPRECSEAQGEPALLFMPTLVPLA